MAFGVLFMQAGLTEDIVQKISDEKDDPVWMREFRMKSSSADLRMMYRRNCRIF